MPHWRISPKKTMAKLRHRIPRQIDGHFANLLKSIRNLKIDIAYLLSKDIPRDIVPPARHHYDDDGSFYRAIHELKRLRQFAVLREAVVKHEIRESLGRRIGITWLLGGPITLLLCIGVALEWLCCLMANPRIADWFSPNHWHYALIHGWLGFQPR